MQRDEAISLLKSYVNGESLINHCIVTAAIMRTVAVILGEDQDKWELIGILYDIDFEEMADTWVSTVPEATGYSWEQESVKRSRDL